MKRKCTLIPLCMILFAGNVTAHDLPKDSLRVIDIEEVMVIATPKENRKLRELPTAVTLLSQQDMQANQVTSLKSLTGVVPNMFIPDYGSKLTSAIYIRGIGSRINTPSVGLYVDNVPYIDKSAFDFNYADIERIDILRGPQGTLYGRNTMAGLIRVHTKSPFSYQGTDVRISAGTHDNYNASLTHYHRISDKFAFSAGGFYGYSGGFFKNSYSDKKMDDLNEVGGRVRAIYFPTQNLKLDLTVSYEYSDQGGYPYFYTGALDPEKEERPEHTGKVSINDKSNYRRNLLNNGLNIEYQANKFTLSAVTGYQHMKDRMFLDQDFTEKDYFTLEQRQRIHTLSEEVVLKSKPGSNWQWATGAFGFYQWLKTDAPVTFKRNGIDEIIEGNVNQIFASLPPAAPQMSMHINNSPTLPIFDNFDTPTVNGAIYHQSTLHNLFAKGLSFTAGLRVDYEKNTIKYNCRSDIDFDFNLFMQMGGRPMQIDIENMQAPAVLEGKLSQDYFQLLPKFALQYEWKEGNNIYTTVSRGYRSGGYNVQMFSDLVRTELENSMKTTLMAQQEVEKFRPMLESYLNLTPIDIKAEAAFDPEYSWNYEVGSHLTLFDGKLMADLSLFYMDTRDQQLSQFVKGTGLGRITVNTGKSRSYGAEGALRAALTPALTLNAAYGYTHATFKNYQIVEDEEVTADYKGNYVPFTPTHTFNIGAQYTFKMASHCLIDHIQLDANYSGAARIYWTEQNDVRQSFYGTLQSRVAFQKGDSQLAFWGRNLLNKKYGTFYFESLGNGFMQKGRPIQLGVDVTYRF